MTVPLPPLPYLRECFDYIARLGSPLAWRARPSGHFANAGAHAGWRRFIGRQAGHCRGDGYWTVRIDNRHHYIHRVVFKLFTGSDAAELDHADGNPSNNQIENLRSVDHAQNVWNARLPDRELPRGVYPAHQTAGWIAQIQCRGRVHHLGTFPTVDLASVAYQEAAVRLRRAA